ncbi:MAG: D-alanyl-D-alanine carboxypeptidase [Clostridia bacterium]|nr:D-alanyl-D-alanine carboxypeptidase [Clostridia bacterium]
MRNKITALLAIFTFLFAVFVPAVKTLAVTDSAAASILMDAGNETVLYAKQENLRLPMASTTKIMTAMLALESDNLDEEFIVTEDMLGVTGTSMYLIAGDTVTMRTLVYGMLLNSGNDAANAAAVRIAGSKEAFVDMMNERARQLGLTNTHFANPEGLDADEHYTSAYDLARLGIEAMKNPEFAKICSVKSTTRQYGNPPYTRYLTNHNKLLRNNKVEGINGIKTGFTDKAGRCLVSSAERDGVHLVCVTLNDHFDWDDHVTLLEYGFTLYSDYTVSTELGDITLPVVGGSSRTISLYCDQNVQKVKMLTSVQKDVEREIRLPVFTYAPLEKGQQVGSIDYTYNGTTVASVPILAGQEVAAMTTGWFSDLAAAIAAV